MTSWVLYLFLLASLSSSVAADDPTGLKVRITTRAQSVVAGVAVDVLKTLVNETFDFPVMENIVECNIKGLTLTRFEVNPADVVVTFQDQSLQLEVRNLNFAVRLRTELTLCNWPSFSVGKDLAFTGSGVEAMIRVKLTRNQQGRLNVEITKCEFNPEHIIGPLLNQLRPIYTRLFRHLMCPMVRALRPTINTMLENIAMVTTVYENVNIDYSVSGDVAVTASSLDVPFKGLVSVQGQDVNAASIRAGANPVFTESDRMAYVGISEFLLNSASMAFYSLGAMKKTWWDAPKTTRQNLYEPPQADVSGFAKAALRALQLFRQPTKMKTPLSYELEVTEPPVISITQKDGMSLTVRARVRVFAEPASREKKQLLTVSANCNADIKISLSGIYLDLPSNNIICTLITRNGIRDILVRPINSVMSDKLKGFLNGMFAKGLQIPLPAGVDFTQGQIDYHNGFVVIGGDLKIPPALVRNMGR